VLYKHNVLDIDNSIVCVYKYDMNVEALYLHIGATIKQKRKQLGWTQEKLAARMATSRASLANIETGRQNVLVHQLYNFASILDLEIADLLPPVDNRRSIPSQTEFPLPQNLNQVQREQIKRLLDGPAGVAPTKGVK
jgi:transcriptional regulator with XRE-family HTH domain